MIHWGENISLLVSEIRKYTLNWIIRKKKNHTNCWDTMLNNYLVVFKEITVSGGKESLKNCSRLKETKEVFQVTVLCNPG